MPRNMRLMRRSRAKRKRSAMPPPTARRTAIGTSMTSSVISHVEAEMRGVAVAHDVVLALDVQLGGGAAGGLGAELDQVLPPDDLGLDEAALEVGVDGAGGAGRLGAVDDGPGAHFGLAGGEEGDEAKEVVAGAHDLVEPRLVHAERGQELGLLFFGQRRDLGLGGG